MAELVRRFAGAIFLIVGSIISIAISSWQYQIDDATSESNWKNYCDNYPTSMLRPISIKFNGRDDPSFCGFSDGITGYRLAVAIVTILFSIVIFFGIFDERKGMFSSGCWKLYSLWFLAAGLDLVSVLNGQAGCKDSLDSVGDCDNSVYGLTIAIDAIMCFIIAAYIASHTGGTACCILIV
eukprot:gene4841-5196_t